MNTEFHSAAARSANALDHDRKYNAEQISRIFDTLLNDGVFSHVEGIYGTVAGEGLQVIVKPGLAWFDHTWNQNDSSMPLSLAPADVTLTRYDAVVLEVNSADRTNSIKIITGTAAVSPSKPALANTATLHQHALAYVKVAGGATSIKAVDIEITVGTSTCPFVTGILSTASIEVLFQGWQEDFDIWFDNLQAQMEGDVAVNLQKQIDSLTLRDVAYLGVNPIKTIASDTVREWIAKGSGYAWYNTAGLLTGQPSQYGFLITYSDDSNTNAFQLWKGQPNGAVYYRAGNSSGWSHGWSALATLWNINNGWVALFSRTTAGPFSYTFPDLFGGKSYNVGAFMIGGGQSGGVGIAVGKASGTGSSAVNSVNPLGGNSGYSAAYIFNVDPGVTMNGVVGSGGASVTLSLNDPDADEYTAPPNPGGSTSFNGVTVLGGTDGEGAQQSRANANSEFGGILREGMSGAPSQCLNPFTGMLVLGAGGSAYARVSASINDGAAYKGGKSPYTTGGIQSGAGNGKIVPPTKFFCEIFKTPLPLGLLKTQIYLDAEAGLAQ